jgi:ADP-ribose pyrophosphatase YjhB (NUDIX family)
MTKYYTTYVDENTILPKDDSISSVFLIAIKDSKILAIKNEKGWDIPGGHVEKGETKEEALIREILEEGGATFKNPRLLAILSSDNQGEYKNKFMLIYFTDDFDLVEFIPSEDALEREVISIEEFFIRINSSYSGLKDLVLNTVERLK